MDQGRYGEGWEAATGFLRNSAGKEFWSESLKAAREPAGCGQVQKGQERRIPHQDAGRPDGEYVVIQYTTAFENKDSAVETVTPMLDKDKAWRVSGYYVK